MISLNLMPRDSAEDNLNTTGHQMRITPLLQSLVGVINNTGNPLINNKCWECQILQENVNIHSKESKETFWSICWISSTHIFLSIDSNRGLLTGGEPVAPGLLNHMVRQQKHTPIPNGTCSHVAG